MSFKTFECVDNGEGFHAVPSEGWSVGGDALVINSAGTSIINYATCDSKMSGFIGSDYATAGMTETEFYELWPLLLGLMVTGFIIKKIRGGF